MTDFINKLSKKAAEKRAWMQDGYGQHPGMMGGNMYGGGFASPYNRHRGGGYNMTQWGPNGMYSGVNPEFTGGMKERLHQMNPASQYEYGTQGLQNNSAYNDRLAETADIRDDARLEAAAFGASQGDKYFKQRRELADQQAIADQAVLVAARERNKHIGNFESSYYGKTQGRTAGSDSGLFAHAANGTRSLSHGIAGIFGGNDLQAKAQAANADYMSAVDAANKVKARLAVLDTEAGNRAGTYNKDTHKAIAGTIGTAETQAKIREQRAVDNANTRKQISENSGNVNKKIEGQAFGPSGAAPQGQPANRPEAISAPPANQSPVGGAGGGAGAPLVPGGGANQGGIRLNRNMLNKGSSSMNTSFFDILAKTAAVSLYNRIVKEAVDDAFFEEVANQHHREGLNSTSGQLRKRIGQLNAQPAPIPTLAGTNNTIAQTPAAIKAMELSKRLRGIK